MTIQIAELKTVVNRLLDDLVARGVTEVHLEKSFYWTIDSEHLYDMSIEPSNLRPDVGSLADDWQFVKTLCDPRADPVTYQLTEVAPLIRYVGETASGALPRA